MNPAYQAVPKSDLTGVRGWLTSVEEAELIRLAQLYSPLNGATILELGGEYGRSASAFAYALQMGKRTHAQIHTIDLFPANHGVVGDLFKVWLENTAPFKTPDVKIIGHQGLSIRYPRGLSTIQLDVLFIDADHHYAYVKADIEKWSPHVVEGGVMILHDYAKSSDAHVQHLDVKQAADEWYAQQDHTIWEFHDITGTSLVYYIRLEKIE